ncbi:dTDP-glucose 4,6-dehydratase [Pseudomaricurvus alkylphenolicus]|uniref:dTDP-glucose 4,6-dehydratase n=1 Tax=Pseudomaricurvus alkylphenolicus TaxID=1306991 RepID=UPI00141FD609|nr:dTDP-glucose 4,6-dehydratase [Pseudomaricurvus alkylphenolicus]NIB40033.1 dTDP-glucose 4,6-dehydratase [Pseudomaricurvus alkylphenolicus]
MKILLTGGAGFIGSALVRHLIADTSHEVCNVDKLTYSGNLKNLIGFDSGPRYQFHQVDICDRDAITTLLFDFQPDCVIHLAAESHVDRSIQSTAEFIETNILGTHCLLEVCLDYQKSLDAPGQAAFRFLHVSTDEVYGSLGEQGSFTESSPYKPNSPYSASKASADHLVRAWHVTYGLNCLTTNCSNNYGSHQHPEKLVPKTIINCILGEKIPIYGQGKQVRDWLFVNDHVNALMKVALEAPIGSDFNIGSRCERSNIELVQMICLQMSKLKPLRTGEYTDLIEFVSDRPGHDFRYAIDPGKIEKELDWKASTPIQRGIEETILWYLNNREWWESSI